MVLAVHLEVVVMSRGAEEIGRRRHTAITGLPMQPPPLNGLAGEVRVICSLEVDRSTKHANDFQYNWLLFVEMEQLRSEGGETEWVGDSILPV